MIAHGRIHHLRRGSIENRHLFRSARPILIGIDRGEVFLIGRDGGQSGQGVGMQVDRDRIGGVVGTHLVEQSEIAIRLTRHRMDEQQVPAMPACGDRAARIGPPEFHAAANEAVGQAAALVIHMISGWADQHAVLQPRPVPLTAIRRPPGISGLIGSAGIEEQVLAIANEVNAVGVIVIVPAVGTQCGTAVAAGHERAHQRFPGIGAVPQSRPTIGHQRGNRHLGNDAGVVVRQRRIEHERRTVGADEGGSGGAAQQPLAMASCQAVVESHLGEHRTLSRIPPPGAYRVAEQLGGPERGEGEAAERSHQALHPGLSVPGVLSCELQDIHRPVLGIASR